MIGTKEICALLLAGGIGAGSVVTVQKVKPAISKPKPRAKPAKVHKAAERTVRNEQISDCPAPSIPSMDVADLGAIPMQPESLLTPTQLAGRIDDGGLRLPSVLGGGGGGGSGPSISPAPPIPGVPQPDRKSVV